MTLKEILEIEVDDLSKLTDNQLITMLGDLIPAARLADKERAVVRDNKALLDKCAKLLNIQ